MQIHIRENPLEVGELAAALVRAQFLRKPESVLGLATGSTPIPLYDALAKASAAAVECRETTKGWIAKRGRQSFTGERSIDTYDPGIVAIGEMSKAIVEALNGKL